jgi:hypothetical protein
MSLGGYAEDFILRLVAKHPELAPVLDGHLKDHGELLPHFFMADIVRFLVARFNDRSERLISDIMATLGVHFADESPEIEELIAASFVENMPYPSENAARIVSLLPGNLKAELARQRGGSA